LVSFWIPALTRKGSRVHRAAGKVFLVAMLVVVATGVPLAARLFWYDQWVFGVFLLYLVVITAAAVGSAWFALRFKREPARYYGAGYRATAWLMLASGLTVIAAGLLNQVWLLFFFGLIGPFVALDMFKRLRATERDANWWLQEHLGGMIGGGIATHVAFGAFGLRQLWPAYASLDGWIGMLPWLAPVVSGTIASILLEKK